MSAGPEAWIAEALDLALRGRGDVEPNPRVGAVALRDGEVVGRGSHRHWGGAHAEVEALRDAARAGATPDAVAVTLEPCSSEGGDKTNPPCTAPGSRTGWPRAADSYLSVEPHHAGPQFRRGLWDPQR